jgi:hypothetical protein
MNEGSTDAFDIAQWVPGFRAPQLPHEQPDPPTLAAADRTMRHWKSELSGPFPPGSEVHRLESCRMFRETFNPYRPAVLAWPKLEPEALRRIVELPIWDIAVQTEGRARLRMAAYASMLNDAEMRDALALNAWEENRHKEVLTRMVQAYGIKLASEPPYVYPKDAEWAYLVTGYSECIDSFFAFGLFEVSRLSGLFPPELIDTFEPVIQEETRHILLFANWVAWHRTRLAWWRRIAFELKVAAVWGFLVWERIGLARTLDAEGNEHEHDNNFTMNGAKSVSDVDINVPDLMRLCLAENDRRFAGYDARLLRPETMPKLVRFALRFVRQGKRAASSA